MGVHCTYTYNFIIAILPIFISVILLNNINDSVNDFFFRWHFWPAKSMRKNNVQILTIYEFGFWALDRGLWWCNINSIYCIVLFRYFSHPMKHILMEKCLDCNSVCRQWQNDKDKCSPRTFLGQNKKFKKNKTTIESPLGLSIRLCALLFCITIQPNSMPEWPNNKIINHSKKYFCNLNCKSILYFNIGKYLTRAWQPLPTAYMLSIFQEFQISQHPVCQFTESKSIFGRIKCEQCH